MAPFIVSVTSPSAVTVPTLVDCAVPGFVVLKSPAVAVMFSALIPRASVLLDDMQYTVTFMPAFRPGMVITEPPASHIRLFDASLPARRLPSPLVTPLTVSSRPSV